MKAITLGPQGLQYTEHPDKRPEQGQVKVRLKTAGLNHRDLFIIAAASATEGAPGPLHPCVLGSDGAGVIEETGEGVSGLAQGMEVIINPCLGWNRAVEVPVVPDILGYPADGTFAEYVIVPEENVVPKPAYLSWEEAGVLPLAALTAYRALFTRGGLKRGDHVLIPGIGGGVATFAALMAAAAGARVTVTSRSEAKRAEALQLPVTQVIDSNTRWREELGNYPVDLILDSVGPATFGQYFEVIKPGGRIVMFGASSGDDLTIPARAIFFPQLQLLGTSMGSHEEFTAMLRFMEQHQIHPIMDSVYSLAETPLALQRMERAEQLGNIALRIG
ncbi:zinc-binding dehydrogenase [Paenibacillus silagei]|uniref:Zinc-binding alcohol dehydrogenase/oxidoreductase n=1 Tax=Paenibacillus silagei TaxID=1670801 RepID=A0ABS4NK50_9BACL|nr:zinc-binding dehydrogenase [Paenibacillus silagei]MBP2110413.1 zinc-binding alcohol dehydrogenase/oxidoreductase [Paenibacillus silagei]